MTRAVKVTIDGRVYWYANDLHTSHLSDYYRSMRVLDGRGHTELVEVDIVERRDTVRDGCSLAAGTIEPPLEEVTATANQKPSMSAEAQELLEAFIEHGMET